MPPASSSAVPGRRRLPRSLARPPRDKAFESVPTEGTIARRATPSSRTSRSRRTADQPRDRSADRPWEPRRPRARQPCRSGRGHLRRGRQRRGRTGAVVTSDRPRPRAGPLGRLALHSQPGCRWRGSIPRRPSAPPRPFAVRWRPVPGEPRPPWRPARSTFGRAPAVRRWPVGTAAPARRAVVLARAGPGRPRLAEPAGLRLRSTGGSARGARRQPGAFADSLGESAIRGSESPADLQPGRLRAGGSPPLLGAPQVPAAGLPAVTNGPSGRATSEDDRRWPLGGAGGAASAARPLDLEPNRGQPGPQPALIDGLRGTTVRAQARAKVGPVEEAGWELGHGDGVRSGAVPSGRHRGCRHGTPGRPAWPEMRLRVATAVSRAGCSRR